MKLFINVAHPVGTARNQLPDLLRQWFGPTAGQPGTDQRARFVPSPDGWTVEPLENTPPRVVHASFGRVIAFPELRVAAGWSAEGMNASPEAEELFLPGDNGADYWAVRASGQSMDGGREPIRDGDWLVCQWRRDAALADVLGRIACVARGSDGDASYHVKRIVQTQEGLQFRSEETGHETLPARQSDSVLALVKRVIRPEDLAPERLATGSLPDLFPWVEEEPSPGWSRIGGHLFLFLDHPGQAESPRQVRVLVPSPRPAETAFVCHRHGEGWRYLGIGKGGNQLWRLAEMDYLAWSALRAEGVRGGLSRKLPEGARERAREFIRGLRVGSRRTLDGLSLTVLGITSKGGVLVEDPGRVNERSVSETDLAWVLLAKQSSAPLDQAGVHQLRYIEGTPRTSTRWLDTGYALHLVLSGLK